ncbi:MAG: HEAT repeat domain-containing protein [Candidatus Riflebacteria bacterium]|nr:HEAT repeat domain-containing protein [Candidatus Riflebacteria bacterium]
MDAIQTLLEDLRSSDPSIRFSVLNRIESMEWTADQVNAFQSMLLAETDPGARFHLQKILAHIEHKKCGQEAQGERVAEVERLIASPERDDLGLALILEGIKRSEAPLVAMALRDAHWHEFSAELLPFVLQFFKKFGSFEDAQTIEPLCRHPDPRVLAAAVEALEKLSPDSLKGLIVPLLVNPVHGIRSRAVRLLYRWDPQEALRHFEAMLFSEDPVDRQAALFHAFFFPFPDIEPLMLRFLGMETDPALLLRAGYLFRANPQPEEPLRLLEVLEASGGSRHKMIEEILKGVLQSLSQAGLVQKTPEQLMIELHEVHAKRKLNHLLDACRLGLLSTDVPSRKISVMRLFELARTGHSEATQLLQRHIAGETVPEIKTLISQQIGSFERPAAASSAQAVKIDLDTLSPDERLSKLAELDRSTLRLLQPKLRDFLRQKATANEKVALIRTYGRVGEKSDASTLQGCLNDSAPEVLAATIEILQKLDPDTLFPFLPKLIQHSADEVRIAALQAFSLFDKKQAITLVEKMMLSIQPKQRRMAIFSAGQFDFPSIREVLSIALTQESDPENLGLIIAVLKANIDEDVLLQILRVTRNSSGEKKDILSNALGEGARILIREKLSTQETPETLISLLGSRLDAESEKKRVAPPSYALNNIQSLRKQQTEKKTESATEHGESLVQFTLVSIGTGAIIVFLIWYFFLSPVPETEKQPVSGKNATATAAPEFDGSSRDITGTITFVDPGGQGIMVKSGTGEHYYVMVKKAAGQTWQKGEPFHGQIRPYKRDRQTILAEFLMSL